MYHVYHNQAAAAYLSLYFFIFQHWNFSSLFSGTVRPRRFKIGTHVDSGQMYHIMYIGIRLLCLFIPLFLHFSFSNFQHWNFSLYFSQELWGLEDWKLVHTWKVGRCIVFTGIRLLLLIGLVISSFFFLSNFQTLKFFVTIFSGTEAQKFGTQVDSGQMYHVYWNQAAAAYLSLCFFIFLSLQFST